MLGLPSAPPRPTKHGGANGQPAVQVTWQRSGCLLSTAIHCALNALTALARITTPKIFARMCSKQKRQVGSRYRLAIRWADTRSLNAYLGHKNIQHRTRASPRCRRFTTPFDPRTGLTLNDGGTNGLLKWRAKLTYGPWPFDRRRQILASSANLSSRPSKFGRGTAFIKRLGNRQGLGGLMSMFGRGASRIQLTVIGCMALACQTICHQHRRGACARSS